jgi:hypothetical protein
MEHMKHTHKDPNASGVATKFPAFASVSQNRRAKCLQGCLTVACSLTVWVTMSQFSAAFNRWLL